MNYCTKTSISLLIEAHHIEQSDTVKYLSEYKKKTKLSTMLHNTCLFIATFRGIGIYVTSLLYFKF